MIVTQLPVSFALDLLEALSMIQIKRTYEPVTREDGRRILVERLWPRGIRKRRSQWTRG